MSASPDRDLERLAAEHAVGLLEGAEAERAAALVNADAAFAARVARWRDDLLDIDDTFLDGERPGPALWSRIQASLADKGAAEQAEPARLEPVALRTRRRERPWQIATAAALAACLALAVGLVSVAQRATRAPVLVAVLLEEGTLEPAAIVNAYRNGRAELVPIRTIVPPPGRALQVWTLWDRAVGPRSLGVLERARPLALDLSAFPGPAVNQLFEITEEPSSGSPTGRPTGRILMKGLAASVP
ncbi:MAG: anti-sigma factor [Alsobacter sp.]